VNGDEVRLGDELVEAAQLEPHGSGALGRDVRVEGDEGHAEGEARWATSAPMPAQADDA